VSNGSTGGSTTPDNSKTPTTDTGDNSGVGGSVSQGENELTSNTSAAQTTPVTSTPTPPDASPTAPATTPVQPTTPPKTQSPANRLYQQLRNGNYTYDQETFWACSTPNENAAFRIQMTGRERDSSFDVTTIPWSAAAVRIDSISDTYDFTARDWINWRVESGGTVLISSTQSEFSASNFRFSSISFDQAGNRFSAIDSNGVDIACARVSITSDPYCNFDSPYGACVLAPMGAGDDAIEVVREFAPTTRLINGTSRHIWNDFWQCSSDSVLSAFRFYFTGSTGVSYGSSQKEPLWGNGWRYEHDGSQFRDNALIWEADALGTVSFVTEGASRTERPLNTEFWSMFDIHASDDGQSFTASDSRGFEFSCERIVESSSAYRACFHAPDTCPAQ